MMTSRQVMDYASARPFRPFCIKVASGQAREIRHPEMILAEQTSVRVHTCAEPASANGDRWQDASLPVMENLGLLEPTGT
jgi:hypothetical protein